MITGIYTHSLSSVFCPVRKWVTISLTTYSLWPLVMFLILPRLSLSISTMHTPKVIKVGGSLSSLISLLLDMPSECYIFQTLHPHYFYKIFSCLFPFLSMCSLCYYLISTLLIHSVHGILSILLLNYIFVASSFLFICEVCGTLHSLISRLWGLCFHIPLHYYWILSIAVLFATICLPCC